MLDLLIVVVLAPLVYGSGGVFAPFEGALLPCCGQAKCSVKRKPFLVPVQVKLAETVTLVFPVTVFKFADALVEFPVLADWFQLAICSILLVMRGTKPAAEGISGALWPAAFGQNKNS